MGIMDIFKKEAAPAPEPKHVPGDKLELTVPIDEWGIKLGKGSYTVVSAKDKRYSLQDTSGKKHDLPVPYVERYFKPAGSSWDVVKDFRDKKPEQTYG